MPPIPYRIPPPLSCKEPLVSIFMFCRNGSRSIRRAIESLLNQPYRNIEFVIQDGLSTDGTLEIFREYQDERIKLVSEKDSGSDEAMYRALRRCRGELIGSCLSDEELLPNAIVEAVEYFHQNPEAGATQRDWFVTDLDGNITPNGCDINGNPTGSCQGVPFCQLDYLARNYFMHYGSAFFRTAALHDVGLVTHDWALDCGESEFWTRFGDAYRIDYLPGMNSKFSTGHEGQLSNLATFPQSAASAQGWVRMVRNFYKESRLLQGDDALRDYIGIGILRRVSRSHLTKKSPEKFAELVKSFQEEFGLNLKLKPSFDLCEKMHRAGKSDVAINLLQKLLRENPTDWPSYHFLADLLAERGMIDQALPLWQKSLTQGSRDEEQPAHLHYLAARIQSPRLHATALLEHQREWAATLASLPLPAFTAPDPTSTERLRLGVHAANWASEEARRQILPVLRELDTERFDLTCYGGPDDALPEITSARTVATASLSESDFAALIRSHRLDVLIELSGTNPGHRWTALAARCAPIQVGYLNHFATSGVPNVDFLLADAVTFPEAEETFTTEKVHRLPGCFTCFDFEPVQQSESPWTKNGFITFGCLEQASRLNPEVLNLWITLLGTLPQSRLLLCNEEVHLADVHNHLRAQFEKYRIARNRLLIFPRRDETLAANLHDQIDIALDPFPHTGTLGTAAALARGVPVVTLRGDRFSSRLSTSLLTAAGLPELVANTPRDYLIQAAALAHDPLRLRQLRADLPTLARTHGLTDIPRFTRQWEAAITSLAGRR